MSNHHLLKTVSKYFWDVVFARKTFELRKNDRNFQVGDTLNLAEVYDDLPVRYTGAVVPVTVTYILEGPGYGLEDGYCIMAIELYADRNVRELRKLRSTPATNHIELVAINPPWANKMSGFNQEE